MTIYRLCSNFNQFPVNDHTFYIASCSMTITSAFYPGSSHACKSVDDSTNVQGNTFYHSYYYGIASVTQEMMIAG